MDIVIKSKFNVGDKVRLSKNGKFYQIRTMIVSGEYDCAVVDYIVTRGKEVKYIFESEIIGGKRK